MNRTSNSLRWTRRTIEQAISLSRLIQITRAARDVELRSPAKQCPECGELVELVVIPGGKCGSCWSKQVIASWQVMPTELAVVRVEETAKLRSRRRK